MTPRTPPPRSPDDRQFARDVAREIDRRRMRRRVTLWTLLLGLIAVALLYLRFGDGLGIGGGGGLGGAGDGSDSQRPLAGPTRCVIRISADGITVDGRAMSRDEAVAACKAASGAEVRVAGDVREGDWQALNTALRAAGIQDLVVYDPTGAPRDEASGSAAPPPTGSPTPPATGSPSGSPTPPATGSAGEPPR